MLNISFPGFPTGERLRDIVSIFETCWEFPQVVGAIDGTCVCIVRVLLIIISVRAIIALQVQAVLDHKGPFLDK